MRCRSPNEKRYFSRRRGMELVRGLVVVVVVVVAGS